MKIVFQFLGGLSQPGITGSRKHGLPNRPAPPKPVQEFKIYQHNAVRNLMPFRFRSWLRRGNRKSLHIKTENTAAVLTKAKQPKGQAAPCRCRSAGEASRWLRGSCAGSYRPACRRSREWKRTAGGGEGELERDTRTLLEPSQV